MGKNQDPDPGSYFPQIRNHFLGLKYLNSLMRIRDGKNPDSGSAILFLTEGSMQDVTVARSRIIFTAIAMTKKILECHCTVSINNSDPYRHSKVRICIIKQLLSHLGTAKRIR
jgi:hypothetical protein